MSIRSPGHAYVPGQSERHPENAFDTIRQTARMSLSPAELARCDAFRSGLVFLDTGYYWEAHEVWEPVWMALPEGCEERAFVQGLIQLANGCLKLRMGRPKAALRLVGIARELMPANASAVVMEVAVHDMHRRVDSLENTCKDILHLKAKK